MADYSKSKSAGVSAFPQKAVDAASFQRVEPLLTAQQLRNRFFVGIPLVSPLTGQIIDDTILKDFIQMACSSVELDIKIPLAPVQKLHRLPFRKDNLENFGYLEVPDKAILTVDDLTLTTSSGNVIYRFPPEWIEPGNLVTSGRIFIIPYLTVGQNLPAETGSLGGVGTGPWIMTANLRDNIPNYFQAKCTHGFSLDGQLPMAVNRLVGLKAAMFLIHNLIPQFQLSSHSLSTDGLSQSQTNMAPQLYQQLLQLYKDEYEDQSGKIAMMYMAKISISTF